MEFFTLPIIAGNLNLLHGYKTSLVVITEQQSTGTNAGSSISNSWMVRTLNTISNSTLSWCTLNTSDNTFTFPIPGVFRITIEVPGVNVGFQQARLFNVTTGLVEPNFSMNGYAATTTIGASTMTARFDVIINPTGTYRIEHRCQQAIPFIGLGIASGFSDGTEIFTRATIEQLFN